jgi:lipid II:glycine glycyltransferase (peptidoglycan interpeptide bridge formation enzyme)
MNHAYEIKIIEDNVFWDEFIIKNNSWSLFQSFNWGEVQKKLANKVTRYALFKNEQVLGVLQATVVNAKRGRFLHIRHGPVIKEMEKSEKIALWNYLVKFLLNTSKRDHIWFIRISPMITENDENIRLLKSLHFQNAPIQAMDAETAWVLDVNKSNEELFIGMRKTTRYLIRQAEKIGVTVQESDNLDNFNKLYKETYERQHFVPHKGIDQEFNIFKKTHQVIILEAKYEGKVLAAALFIAFGNQLIYHHSASITNRIPVNYLLQWRAIERAKQMGKSIYNFWGIAPTDNLRHPWRGLTLFKQGFGGREVRFMHAQDLPLSPFYKISYTIEMVRKTTRGY